MTADKEAAATTHELTHATSTPAHKKNERHRDFCLDASALRFKKSGQNQLPLPAISPVPSDNVHDQFM